MTKIKLSTIADQLPRAWNSMVVGQAAGANLKVLRMDAAAYPDESHDFDEALGLFRAGKFPEAGQAFAAFTRQWPKSGYMPSVRFWLGNSQYATRDYKNAIGNFRSVMTNAPMHARAPEAALSIANCQVELKDTKAARKTLEDLLQAYPNSEAAGIAKTKLATLK